MCRKLQITVLALVWGLISVAQSIVTFLVDDRFQAYRGWEYARVGAPSAQAPFRPFAEWNAWSYGDLSHMAGAPQLRVYRWQRFTTDEYGYRNPVGTLDTPCDVVVIGDSASVGSQASDDETLSGLIRIETPLGVYNAGGGPTSWFFGDGRFVARPPKLLIVVVAERVVGTRIQDPGTPVPQFRPKAWKRWEVEVPAPFETMGSPHDVLAALDSGRALRPAAEPLYKGLLFAAHLYRLPPQINCRDQESGMLFFSEGVDRHLNVTSTMADIDRAIQIFKGYERECSRRGMELLVVVIPEKETVYADRVPALRGRDVGAPLRRLVSGLESSGISQLEVRRLFSDYRRRYPEALLYYLDDTHINPLGHCIVFDALRERLPDRHIGMSGADGRDDNLQPAATREPPR